MERRPATAAFAAFYETMVMMAAGGLLAAVVFAPAPSRSVPLSIGDFGTIIVPLALLGLGPAVAFLVADLAEGLPGVDAADDLAVSGRRAGRLAAVPPSLAGRGAALVPGGLGLLGLSQVAVIHALTPTGLPPSAWPLAMASVALATVAGFLVPVAPGGLGVREWVLWTALGSVLDHDRAVFASLALRLAWVVGEIVGAAALAPWRPRDPPASEPETSRPRSPPESCRSRTHPPDRRPARPDDDQRRHSRL